MKKYFSYIQKKMPMLQKLKDILRENDIKGRSHFNKPEIIELLTENNLLHAVKSKPQVVNPK